MSDMYTILINEDHSFTHTNKKRIMCRSTGIDKVKFLVNQTYGNLDMTTCNVVLEYVTPISRKYDVIVLTKSEELYKNRVEYILPIDTRFTSEVGDLEFTISFTNLNLDNTVDINAFTEQVRKIGTTTITIHDTVRWSDYIASSSLDNIAQIMLTQQSLMEQQKVYAEMIAYSKADGIAKDEETNEIYLTSNGVKLGEGVIDDGIGEDGIPIIKLNPDDSGEENIPVVPEEDDNVVEFGYADMVETTPEQEDFEVVHF